MAEILSELINCKSNCTVHVSYRSVRNVPGKEKRVHQIEIKDVWPEIKTFNSVFQRHSSSFKVRHSYRLSYVTCLACCRKSNLLTLFYND